MSSSNFSIYTFDKYFSPRPACSRSFAARIFDPKSAMNSCAEPLDNGNVDHLSDRLVMTVPRDLAFVPPAFRRNLQFAIDRIASGSDLSEPVRASCCDAAAQFGAIVFRRGYEGKIRKIGDQSLDHPVERDVVQSLGMICRSIFSSMYPPPMAADTSTKKMTDKSSPSSGRRHARLDDQEIDSLFSGFSLHSLVLENNCSKLGGRVATRSSDRFL